MLNNFVGKDIINIGDMTPDQFQYLLDLSKMLKAEKMTGDDHARFHNKNVVAHFEWESTRTRCAFETSCHDLGLGFTYPVSYTHLDVYKRQPVPLHGRRGCARPGPVPRCRQNREGRAVGEGSRGCVSVSQQAMKKPLRREACLCGKWLGY